MSAGRALWPVVLAYAVLAALVGLFFVPTPAPVALAPNTQARQGILRVNGRARIDINTADAPLLETLPGIGETLAARIVAVRTETGAFADIADLTRVSGISQGTLRRIGDKISVSP